MPSRLKGIETCWKSYRDIQTTVDSLDMPSRLKGIETKRFRLRLRKSLHSLDMPSRLKGIETFNAVVAVGHEHSFGYAFPFEGN